MSFKKSDCKNISLLLSEYLDDQLDEGDVFQISAHLTECKSCYNKFENLASVRKMVKEIYATPATPHCIDISSKVMSRINIKNYSNVKNNDPKIGRYFVYAAATLFLIFSTIVYTQGRNKDLMADKSKFNTYAMEHANTVYDDTMVRDVRFSSVNLTVGK